MSKYLRVNYEFAGHDHFIWEDGQAWIEGAPFIVGAIRVNGRYYVPAPASLQEELADYSSLARSQRRHWEKIRVLKGLERKKMLEKLKRRKDEELRLKSELPWASPTSIGNFYKLTGLEGIYRLSVRGGKGSKIKAVWFPSRITAPESWRRHKNGQIRTFVPVSEDEIFE